MLHHTGEGQRRQEEAQRFTVPNDTAGHANKCLQQSGQHAGQSDVSDQSLSAE